MTPSAASTVRLSPPSTTFAEPVSARTSTGPRAPYSAASAQTANSIGARTPAMLAMSAVSPQNISGDRFVLGIGTSGPQAMEGWHGARFSRPARDRPFRCPWICSLSFTVVARRRLFMDPGAR